MPKLTANVVLTHPETGEPVVLQSGSDLPDWAGDLVGDHVLEPDEKPKRGRRTNNSE